MRASIVVAALALAGCASDEAAQAPSAPPAASAKERAEQTEQIRALAARRGTEPTVVASGIGEQARRQSAVSLVADKSGQFAFTLATDGTFDDPAAFFEGLLPEDAPADVVAAASMGLGYSKSDATERVLVDLALRPSQPPEAVEALFSYYRMRGGDKPFPATLPDDRLLAYAKHPQARGRAALGHLGRVIKDPALVDVLGTLAVSDADFEVRRAAFLGLGEGPAKKERPADLRSTCLDFIRRGLADSDQRVVAAACRAASSYDDPSVVAPLAALLSHADFNVRVAALEGLGRRKAKDVVPAMAKLAQSDPSTSVRYAAATQIASFDAEAAQKLVDGLLGDANEYVRCAGVEVLGKSQDLSATPRLAQIAQRDPHVRVRETAVGTFEGKKDSAIAKDAVKAALADADPVVVATACGVVAKNGWTDLFATMSQVPGRFPGCLGADAREAALTAMSEVFQALEKPAVRPDRSVFEPYLQDANPAVRAAAEKAVAAIDAKAAAKDGAAEPPPPMPTRGADLTGELLPGGAPIFEKDAFLVVETSKGTMKIRLFPDQAPVHCAHVAALAKSGFYDGLTWHRVVPDFVIQGGCPRGDGSGNAGVTLPLEPTRVPFERGTLGMPRSDHPDTGGCQLFICHSRAPHLDVRYTAFGKVVEGLDVIDKIDVDDKIVRVRVEGAR